MLAVEFTTFDYLLAALAAFAAGIVNALAGGGTLISFKHSLVGPVPDEFQQHMAPGWEAIHARVKRAAEAARQE